MGWGLKRWYMVSTTILLLNLNLQGGVDGEALVPCYFIFGDSVVDNGNNNDLPTLAKVNYLPYGIDFPSGPTGRFSNGRNLADILAELLGFEDYIPPYATARGKDILKGVNYASGGSGILDETGLNLGTVISLNQQLINHRITVSRISQLLGNDSAADYLSHCIYTSGSGNNDYANNYFMPEAYHTNQIYTPEEFAHLLIHRYTSQLRTLYGYGARKIALFGVGKVGCDPSEVSTNGSCDETMNDAAEIFNNELKSLVDELNNGFPDATFIYVNFSGISSTGALGFPVTTTPCCKISNDELCEPQQLPCSNRAEYVFWDGAHTSEALNVIIAERAYNAQSSTDAYPIDIHRLAQSNHHIITAANDKQHQYI